MVKKVCELPTGFRARYNLVYPKQRERTCAAGWRNLRSHLLPFAHLAVAAPHKITTAL